MLAAEVPMFPSPDPALVEVSGRNDVVFTAPHGHADFAMAAPFVDPDPAAQAELEARVAEWHDEGSREALHAAATATGRVGLRPVLPRGLMDLNRGWKGRVEAKETLFGKGALDAWAKGHLVAGAESALETWYRAALLEVRRASEGARGLVELHSYGDLGSTYDKQAGGRPVRRSEAAIIPATPWASAYPVGLARFLPGDLRGSDWALDRRVGDALGDAGLRVGPHPYPAQGPWTLSIRFLAARWFRWLGDTGRVGKDTADALIDRAWTDEQSEDAPGSADLAREMGAWSHAPGDLGARFREETGVFTLVAELRVDLVHKAEDFGRAVASAVTRP